MRFTLGRRAEQWNGIARADRLVTRKVRTAHAERLCCQLLGQIGASETRVLLGIEARTLRFGKFAESIGLTEFCKGFRDETGQLVANEDGEPYFAGCNIAKEETVSKALAQLEERGLITRWHINHRWPSTYMPFGEDWLAQEIGRHRGAIAADYESVVVGEHFRRRTGQNLLVAEVDDRGVLLQPVNDRLDVRGDSPFYLSAEEWAEEHVERLTVEDVLTARRHR